MNLDMNIALNKLIKYCENHSTTPSDALYELERETNLKTLSPQMLSGHLQGQLLAMICAIKQPKHILEIGSFTGYTAISMAQQLPKSSMLHAIEANEELAYIIRKYIKKAAVEDRITLYIGDAKQIVPTLDLTFDMVFIDAGKKDNALYYDLIFDKISPNGLILVDNVLWSGKVTHKEHDNDTRIIHAFNTKIKEDTRVEKIILPIRDGITVIRKK